MQIIEIHQGIQVRLDDLVKTLSNMDISDLKSFAEKMNHLVDLRYDTPSNKAEKELMQKIKDVIPASVVRRYKQLRKKQGSGILTTKEQEEVLMLTDFIEEKSTERVFLLGLLAKKRNLSLPELIKRFPLIIHE